MALAGLLLRRYRWGCRPAASWCSGFSLATVFVVFVLESYPFLAITSPVPSDTLAVEGWMAPIRDAGGSSRVRNYRHLFTTGGPTIGKGGYINDYYTIPLPV